MSKYYYFASTLPSLSQDAQSPMALSEFMERASRYLKPADLDILKAATLFLPESGHAPAMAQRSVLLTRYYRWELALRNELVRLRAAKLQRQAEKYYRPGEPEYYGALVAQAAMQAEDPLQGELVIERERWAFIESLATNKFFDMEFLASYALLLQIQARRARFVPEAGEAGYGTVYRSVLDTAEYRDESGVER